MPIPQYTQEEMWKIYEKLPEQLKGAVFSAENADYALSVCERYEISECSQLASLIGLVLMGVMLPRNFESALVKDLGLDSDTAQRVAQEVNRLIFYPVKQQLEDMHRAPGEKEGEGQNIGIATPRHAQQEQAQSYIEEPEASEEEPAQEEPELFPEESKQNGPDQYRESIDEN